MIERREESKGKWREGVRKGERGSKEGREGREKRGERETDRERRLCKEDNLQKTEGKRDKRN